MRSVARIVQPCGRPAALKHVTWLRVAFVPSRSAAYG